ncbi:MAG: alpha/beta hydrolase [Xanthomonadales bacterium]|jgi:alpha-beta hydrolase superfamily lysophospholipase|nr:alpha/beta hydrolase [Xanthomonadales bacterium]
MSHQLRFTLTQAWRLFFYGTIGVVLTLIVVFVLYLDNRDDLDAWHMADLDQEFTEDSDISNFSEYLALEERLFGQLDKLVYEKTGPVGNDLINRYKRGSLSDPERWPRNWNRSFEMQQETPRASVLLLHGLSDSPYSLRSLAERLHESGLHALGLRIPGHGTVPSGLVKIRWQDMAAAVRLAVLHLEEQNGDRPIHILGYSNGAALAIEYALSTLDDPALPRIDSLVLLSPEIGITSAAAMAIWQARLGRLLGLDKLAWNDILPEYEPFKYGSFAVNAGDLSHRLTMEIQRRIGKLQESGEIGAMPPVLAFSSVVDSTVLAPALVSNLFNRLPAGGHELVLFDINAQAGIEPLLNWSPDKMLDALGGAADRTFTLRLVTNKTPGSRAVVEQTWKSGKEPDVVRDIGLEWPAGIYSLSHVALPFAPDDPVYGGEPSEPSPGVQLGNLAWRGEKGVLKVSPTAMLRLRWNPFYSYLEEETLEFLELDTGSD